ncbi:MAG: ABC transporter ATP-binding protein [Pseudomonadota bacterium]
MEQPLIELDNGWKKFSRTVASNRKRLSRSIVRSAMGLRPNSGLLNEHEYWALEGIYLSLDRGQSVGLLGRNGAGKSTLLQILAGHMDLDHGALAMRGRVAELINLTAGFQPLLSGRENIVLGCRLRGLSGAELRRRTEEMIDFAEIEAFIDAPYVTYSMGMKMRLAFAVNVLTDPDILLIDEVIGVGDAAFRQKCMEQMERMRHRCAIVLCTHSTGMLSKFCEFGVILDKGKMVFAGMAQDAAQAYLETEEDDARKAAEAKAAKAAAAAANAAASASPDAGSSADGQDTGTAAPAVPTTTPALNLTQDDDRHVYLNDNVLKGVTTAWCNQLGEPVDTFEENETARLSVRADFHPNPPRELARFVVYLTDRDGNRVGHTSIRARPSIRAFVEVDLTLDLSPLANGHYNVELRIVQEAQTLYRAAIPPLLINRDKESWGPVALRGEWSVRRPARNKPPAGAK